MLNDLVQSLPARFRPAAKTVVAGVGALAVAAGHGLVTGHWDQAAIDAGVGLVIAGLVYGTPNID